MKNGFYLFVFGILLMLSCNPDLDLVQAVLLPPSKVDLVFPENNSECTTGSVVSDTESEVVFEWTNAAIGDRYIVTLTNLTNGQEQFYQTKEISLPITLLRGTPYQWQVATELSDSKELTTSDPSSFYNAGPGLQSFSPFPAAAISPKNGALVTITENNTITLQWDANDLDNDIVSYDVYFGTENPPELNLADITGSMQTNVTVVAGTTYYWKVVTKDTQGNESNSQIFSFDTATN